MKILRYLAHSSLFSLLILLLISLALVSEAQLLDPELPTAEVRKAMVLEFANQIKRLDGDGLPSRENRPESWDQTIATLVEEASAANSLYDLGRVFRRLDAAYPNLHAQVFMIPEMNERKARGAPSFPFKFFPESADREHQNSSFRVVVNGDATATDLRHGDELLAINSRSVNEWTNENFIFCKFPLRAQCDIEFFDNFRRELLSWNRHQPLELTVRREKKTLKFNFSLQIESGTQGGEAGHFPCGISPDRYKNFRLVYEGENLCAFESKKDNRIVALRIKSFVYKKVLFAALDGEVQIFWSNYWKQKSPTVKTLILDVIDNYGGQSPVPYYGLFYPKPYQELYVQFKKIEEFEQKEILESLFWGDKAKQIWFDSMRKDGSFAALGAGGFLGQVPMFCTSSNSDCRGGLFEPRKHGFKGRVKLLMNHWCISSCVGFVSNIKDLLKDRVQTYGIPDSGDSTYSRLAVVVSPLKNGKVESKVAEMSKARDPDKPEPWVRQIVSVTRSTDKDGNVVSGKPQHIDFWVPRKWNQTGEEWAASVFDKAVKNN